MREAARQIGISPAYLVEIEHGRNPSTGRAPVPSPTVLRGIERALGIDMATLLDLTGAAPARSAHALLFQAGRPRRPTRAAAGHAARAAVDTWLEIGGQPTPGAALRAVTGRLRAEAAPKRRVGLIFTQSGAGLRAAAPAIVASERTWEEDVAATCRTAAGIEPAANVCVYREADLRDAPEPVQVALDLIRAHPRVAAQDPRGRVTTGPAAIAAILAAVRPAGIDGETWASLSAAAALGLHRETAA